MGRKPADSQDKSRRYWETHAPSYDRTLKLLGGAMPRMLALVGEAVSGAERVLEVAAGTGLVTPVLAAHAAEVVATDYTGAMVERLRARVREHDLHNVRCEQADIYALPFAPGSFDLVVAANVLHVAPDLAEALAAFRRVLRPGGKLVAPTFCHDETKVSWMLSRLLAMTGFPGRRRFTTASLQRALADAGIRVERAETLPGLFPIGYVEGAFAS